MAINASEIEHLAFRCEDTYYVGNARWSGDRGRPKTQFVAVRGKSELHETQWRVIPAESDLRESATENKLPVRGNVHRKR